ncbi:short-chain dehydrogenase [Streptomyces sp. NPDC021098]|uniref:short-chain dehydrogenase n=1 Tax=unclassified Streptomyces TaxID=2593676 RepID=UPI00378B4CF0
MTARTHHDSLRQEVGTVHGIQIATISPGVIDTGWADKVTHEEGKQIAKNLNQGAISPQRIADAVVYALDQPANVTVDDIVIHPAHQDW